VSGRKACSLVWLISDGFVPSETGPTSANLVVSSGCAQRTVGRGQIGHETSEELGIRVLLIFEIIGRIEAY
jgi:hypothetical protein